ncbi:MAG: hypothetical protein H6661_02525 [Ardenticatenaceae bacterium]|nr:hypothetical protein [Ardenticatenaceae bacterium]
MAFGAICGSSTAVVVYRAYPQATASPKDLQIAPAFSGSGDLTGDGLPELVTKVDNCGAHTCFSNFQIISQARGSLEKYRRRALDQ